MLGLQVPHLPFGLLQLLPINLVILGETPGTRIAPVSPQPEDQRDDRDKGDEKSTERSADDRHSLTYRGSCQMRFAASR
jgi:hypothetical protein